jgi:tetratricopeptide (TPR) repeat protein
MNPQTTITVRPQPVGLQPGAEGLLLVTDGGPGASPHVGDDPIGWYNGFVLQPDADTYHALAATFDGALVDLLGVAAYTVGVIDEPPAETPALDGELRALALATRAAWQLERGDMGQAMLLLKQAAVGAAAASPLLAAALFTELGMLYQDRGGSSRGALAEAVKAYQDAIHLGYDAENRPEQYGLLQNNIGLAYLSMPMVEASDQLRMAVAVQSFREACRMFSRESNPEMWAATNLNLANSLQYLPSSHPAENLGKAVEIYEQLLEVRDREQDPVGYARVLANQANALAHLGGLVVALGKFREARGMAMRAGASDLEEAITEQIDRIENHRAKGGEGDTSGAAASTPSGGAKSGTDTAVRAAETAEPVHPIEAQR